MKYLFKLVDPYAAQPNRRIDWTKIESDWQDLVSENKVRTRTRQALQACWRRIKGKEPILFPDHADVENNDSQAGNDDAGPAPATNDSPPDTALDAVEDDESAVNTAREHERDFTEAQFRAYFSAEFGKALSKVERKPIGQVKQYINPNWITWANRAIQEIIDSGRKEGRLIVLNAAVYAAGRTVKHISSGVPEAMKNSNGTYIQSLKAKRSEILREIGHATQELDRRARKTAPTRKQVGIIRSFKAKGLKKTEDLENRLLNLKERLIRNNQDLKLKLDEIKRKDIRLAPIGRLFRDPQDNDQNSIAPNRVREYWVKISGTRREFKAPDEFKEWRNKLPCNATTPCNLRESWDACLRKVKSWRAPGPDGIAAFWYKTLRAASEELFSIFQTLLDDNSTLKIPNWFVRGRVVLLPKGGDPQDPGNYRPIACLNTAYKLLTAMMASQWRTRIDEILPKQQLAMRKGIWGCTHAHAIDQAIFRDVKSDSKGKRSVHVGWVDYSKAFDSIPHNAISWALEAAGVNRRSADLYREIMRAWTVKYEIRTPKGKRISKPMKVKCGVLQGDTLSPLLFCLTIAPISFVLQKAHPGYSQRACIKGDRGKRVNHLYYMDDLKIYAESEKDLETAMEVVKSASLHLNLHMNSKKCATAHISAAKRKGSTQSTDAGMADIPQLGQGDCYKYLGIEQGTNGTAFSELGTRLTEKVLAKTEKIWKSELTFHQMVKATNTSVMPILRYAYINSFVGAKTFSSVTASARGIDSKIKEILTQNKARFSKCNVDRLYLPTEMGGYGLTSAEDLLEDSTVYAYLYLRLNPQLGNAYESLLRAANRGKRTIIADMRKICERYGELSIDANAKVEKRIPVKISFNNNEYLESAPTIAARRTVIKLRETRIRERLQNWSAKPTASQIPQSSDLDTTASFLWLSKGLLNPRAVRDIIATQEGQLRTNAHPAMGNNPNKRCRQCGDDWEDACHVVSGCPTFRSTLMVSRHDAVARQMHYAMCRRFGIKPPSWKARIPTELSNSRAKIWWNRKFSESMVDHNTPDLVVYDKQDQIMHVIEFTVVWWKKLERSEIEKFNRYSINGSSTMDGCALPYPSGACVASELGKLYKVPVSVSPIVIGACGEVRATIWNHLRTLGFDNHDAKEILAKMQRSAVLGTDLIIRAHLSKA